MGDAQNEHERPVILNLTHYPVIAYSVPPQAHFLPLQRLPKLPWVTPASHTLLQESDDPPLRFPVDFAQFGESAGLEANGPSQVSSPLLPVGWAGDSLQAWTQQSNSPPAHPGTR
jgi:hypothetical protein